MLDRLFDASMKAARAFRVAFARGFDAAGAGGRWPANQIMFAPAREALAARYRLAARAGYVVANSPTAEAIASAYVSNCVGDGPSVQSGHPDEGVREALEDAWAKFYSRCDVEGVSDLADLLSRLMRSLVVNGEGLAHMLTVGRGELRLRLLSPEQLDSAITRDSPPTVAGVEFDAMGRRVAYHILPAVPDMAFTIMMAPVRVPAEDVCHVFENRVVGSVRGISWLTPVLTRLAELDKLEDALSARMNAAALFCGFVTDVDGTGFADAVQISPDQSELSLEPGMMRRLPVGSSVVFPNVPGIEGAPELLKHMIRSVASGAGVPPFLVDGDFGQINYSSGRLGMETFKRRCTAIRASLLGAQLLDPIWRRFVTLEVLSGRLYAPDFETDPESYYAVTWMWPQWPSLSPLDETKADALAVQAGLRSRQEVIASRGRDPDDVDAEIAADSFTPAAPPAGPTNGVPNAGA